MQKAKRKNSKILLTKKPVREKKSLFKDADGNMGIVVDLSTGAYYSLNECGKKIWELLDGKKPVLKIGENIARQFAVDKPAAIRDVEKFIIRLNRLGLIRLL